MSKNRKLSFKEAAIQILRSEKEPLSAKEIVDLAFNKNILFTEGKTPEATMAAQLYVDINSNKKTKFNKVGRGKFSLREQKEFSTTPLLLIDQMTKRSTNSLTGVAASFFAS